jgi:hypothetical protein
VPLAAFLLVVLAALGAIAQSPATKGLSGPTLNLFKAVELNDMAAVKASLDEGADLSKQNENGLTAPDLAVDMGHFIVAHYLLSRRLLGQTEPVVLAPAKAEATPKVSAEAKPKPAFSTPPGKPKPPAPVAAAKPSAPAAAAKPGSPPAPSASPKPAMPAPEIAEAPASAAKPAEPQAAADKAAPATNAPPQAVAEKAAPPTAPSADTGIAEFFKSLVDLITPGGEKPAEVAASKEAAPRSATTPGTAQAPDKAAPAAAKSAAGDGKAEPPEIVVDLTGPGAMPGEIIEEIKEVPPAKPEESNLETITAETTTVEADKVAPPAKDKASDAVDKPAAKEKKPAGTIAERMAGLFKADQATGEPETAPGPPAAAKPPTTVPPPAAAPAKPAPAAATAKGGAPGATPGTAPGTAPPGSVATYDLPTPPPAEPRKFSPRFLDRLADFLESGDEAAFKAWLPEMRVMNGGQLPQPAEAGKTAGQKIAEAPLPAPDKAAGAATTGEAAMPSPPMAAKAPIKVTIDTGEPDLSPTDALEADLAGIAGESRPTMMAAATPATPGPPATPAQGAKPGVVRGVFNKLLGAFGADSRGDKDQSGRVVLAPEEKLAAVEQRPAQAPSAIEPSKVWPVTEVEQAKTPPVAMRRQVSDVMMKTSLTGVTLSIGESVSLENSYPPSGDGTDPLNQCVKKNRGTTLFCLEPVDWPERMQGDFLVPTILYTGHKAIARFDQGIASRLHALFPSDALQRVVDYFRERYGEPTDVWNRSIAPFAQPRQDNPTLAWRSVDPKSGVISVLEVRKYDDTRGGFPDTNRGVVMLYLANSPPIFPQVSTHELMRLSRTRMDAPSPDRPPNQLGLPDSPAGAPPEPAGAAQPDLSLPGSEPAGAQSDLSLPEPGVEAAPADAGAAAGEPGAAGKTEKQLKDEARAKRRAEREAKRAAGAAKQAAGSAQQEIGAKRAAQGKAPATAKPAPADQSLDLPPDPKKP